MTISGSIGKQAIAELFAVAVLAASMPSKAAGLNPVCTLTDSSQRLICDLRLARDIGVTKLEASWDDGKTRLKASYQPFDPASAKFAGLILGTPADGLAPKALAALQKDLAAAKLAKFPDRYRFGLARAAVTLEAIAPIGSAAAELDKALPDLLQGAPPSDLVSITGKAVDQLTGTPASRRLLIVVSAAPQAFGIAKDWVDVLVRARQGNVVIHTIDLSGGPADAANEADATTGFGTLSATTGGLQFGLEEPDRKLPGQIVHDIAAATESGGLADLSTEPGSGDTTVQLFATLADGTSEQASLNLTLPEKSFSGRLMTFARGLYQRQTLPVLAIAGLTGLLLAGSLLTSIGSRWKSLFRRRNTKTEAQNLKAALAAADVTKESPPRLARDVWLEGIGGLDAIVGEPAKEGANGNVIRLPVRGTMVRIGRHEENDIRLASKTVHRYHAIMHKTPEEDYVVTDLSGPAGNGILVNGAKVQNIALKEGDIIELGDVKLKFRLTA